MEVVTNQIEKRDRIDKKERKKERLNYDHGQARGRVMIERLRWRFGVVKKLH